MKRKLIPFILLTGALLLGGCHEEIDNRIAQLKEDVSALEQQVSNLNDNIASLSGLVSALEKNDHITGIKPWSLLDMTGYQISFSSGTTLRLQNGLDGVKPIVGVRYNEDYDAYYWTIQWGPNGKAVWMTDSSGRRVRATSWTPQLKIEEGVWWYSFDGSYWNKTTWVAAQGQAGTAFFSSIDTSNPYYVTFLLTDNTRFQIPTQEAVDQFTKNCEEINNLFKTYTDLISQTDSSIFVQSVAEFKEDGVSGARITLGDGQVLTIRNGFDSRDSVLLSAKAYTDGKYYWAYRNRSEEEYQWLLYKGKMVCVSLETITPQIGITDSLGVLYLTITYGDGPTEIMCDADGNPVPATGRLVPDFFTSADISDPDCVVLTLSDGTIVRLPRGRVYTPSVTCSLRDENVQAATSYTYQLLLFVKDTLQQKAPCGSFEEYQAASGTKLEAVAIDDGYVSSIEVVSMYSDTTNMTTHGYVSYDFIFDVRFTTGPMSQWNTAYPSRIAVFLSWQDKTIMKVVSFRRTIPATAVALSATALELNVGASSTLKATVSPGGTTDTVTWKTSDAKIATVTDGGVVKAVATGTCTITATAGRHSATCTVTVTPATP